MKETQITTPTQVNVWPAESSIASRSLESIRGSILSKDFLNFDSEFIGTWETLEGYFPSRRIVYIDTYALLSYY